jgi:hypothetical protein
VPNLKIPLLVIRAILKVIILMNVQRKTRELQFKHWWLAEGYAVPEPNKAWIS